LGNLLLMSDLMKFQRLMIQPEYFHTRAESVLLLTYSA
jgi:hypothetical protein